MFRQLVRPVPDIVPVRPVPLSPVPKFMPETFPVMFWRLLWSPARVLVIWLMLLTRGAVTGFVKVTWCGFVR